MLSRALAAAETLAGLGIDAAVLNLRWLNPLDEAALSDLIGRTGGRILIVHEAVRTGGFAGEIAMRLSELAAGQPLSVRRLTTPDVRIPASAVLQAALLPSAASIAAAARDLAGPAKAGKPGRRTTPAPKVRASRGSGAAAAKLR
jgi:2-oxoisovalerate dehydrogenase E1 component